jgi:molecular chaperone HtpG
MSSEQNFQVNLGGVIKLLSDHLYSGPEVFVRELLQNAVDAITARRLRDPNFVGKIRVEVMQDDRGNTITVEEDGIGLTESEIHQFLATIGQSSKSGEFSRDDFIGQFGIGLLSAFVVADSITVITQSIDIDSPTLQWTGRANGTYSIRPLDSKLPPGTRVYLQPKEGKQEFFEPQRVEQLLKHFGNHLPYAISLQNGERVEEINEIAPWRQEFTNESERKQCWLEYGRAVFGTDFMDAVAFSSRSGELDGIAFILPHVVSPASKQSHRVYLKNMLLSESMGGLLPDWAFFVRCVVNSNRLRPNAARDAFYNDDALAAAQREIGNQLKSYLTNLAKFDRPRLDKVIQLHYLPIKSLAVQDEEFFQLFIPWLPFETSHGMMTLEEYFRTHSSLRYVRDLDQFRQISSVASAQNLCLFNGGYTYDSDLLDRVGIEFPDRDVKAIEADELVQEFKELTFEESQQVFDFVKLADLVLQKYKCRVEVRRFVPADLPTLYTTSESARFFRYVDQSTEVADEMWSGILESVSAAVKGDAYAQLVLNFNNGLIQRISTLRDKQLLKQLIEILYLQSLLLGHYPLSTDERLILSNGLSGLIDYFIKDL